MEESGLKLRQSDDDGDGMQQLARKLFDHDGVKKSEVIKVLGKLENEQLRVCYLALHDFEGKTVTDSLREFLSRFSLNAESQVIDRVLEAFSHRFFEQNKERLKMSEDAIHGLVAAILLLNTDLHSVNVEVKMTLPQFVSNIKSLDNGSEYTTPFLESIYQGIKEEALSPVLDDSTVSQTTVTKEEKRFSVARGRSRGVLDPFFLTEEPGVVLKSELVRIHYKKKTRVFGFKRNGWTKVQVSFCGSYLLFHKCAVAPQVGDEGGKHVYEAILLRHTIATRRVVKGRPNCLLVSGCERPLYISFRDGITALEWGSELNLMAAQTSAAPLPGPITSMRAGFKTPLLPKKKTKESLHEISQRLADSVCRNEKEMSETKELLQNKLSKTEAMYYGEKCEYLELALEREKTYLAVVREILYAQDGSIFTTKTRLNTSIGNMNMNVFNTTTVDSAPIDNKNDNDSDNDSDGDGDDGDDGDVDEEDEAFERSINRVPDFGESVDVDLLTFDSPRSNTLSPDLTKRFVLDFASSNMQSSWV
eukprot:m.4255 g.4255  ORF g.4255 m.4255 type:complete len:533 (+) comp3851_c1_seq1:43-1641(+)